MIRIKDIADKAGVSTTTVSNVIHGNTKKVSKETIEKVQKLLEEYAYVPSMSARTLAGGISHIVGVLVGGRRETIEHSAFVNRLIHELEFQLYKNNYYMLIHFSDSPKENIKFAATWAVDGVITIGISEEDNRDISRRIKMPMVSVDVYYGDFCTIANVGSDDFKGGYEMGKFLQEQGHHQITFLADNDIGVDNRRWNGLVKACMEAGYPLKQERHIILPQRGAERRKFYQGCMWDIARESDALFYASDYYAMEGILVLNGLGISVPEDISVAGFDDNEFATLSSPQLTTMHQDIKEKAKETAGLLFEYLEEEGAPLRKKLDVSLVIRDSVKLDKNK